MCLEQHRLAVFIAFGGGLAHHYVPCGVYESLYAGSLGEVEQELLHFFNVSRRTWYLRQRIKIAPDGSWFQIGNFTHS